MSEQWEVFVAGHPRPQGSIALWTGRDGKERAKYASTTVAWRNTLHLHLSEWWAGRPALTGPVRAEMLFVLPRPKAHWSARGGLKPSAPMYHTQQYDLDKLVRAVDDAMTSAGVWVDDGQVAALRADKVYQADELDRPGAHIRVELL